MSYSIDLGQWNSIFAVPSAVVDKHIKLASEAQLKVLLYILRHSGETVDAETMERSLGISADEIRNAVDFWTERGLVKDSGTVLSPAEGVSATSDVKDAPAESEAKAEEPKKRTALSRAVRPDSAFVSRLLAEDKSLVGLLEEAQSVMGKPLSSGDTATLVMLYDSFGLPCDVIAMLLNYTSSIGSANMRTVERIGINWADNGVLTTEAAEHEIERMTASRNAWGRVAQLIGLHNAGNPTNAQMTNADRWLNIWGFNDDMIVEAYERTVNKKGEFNMSYMNGILKKWYEKRIFSLETLKEEETAETAKKAKKSTSSKGSVFSADGASFDISDYEKQSLFDD